MNARSLTITQPTCFWLTFARLTFISLTLASVMPASALATSAAVSSPPTLTWEWLQTYDHTPSAFTQGLELHGGTLYESSGLYGYSRILARTFPPVRADKDSLRGVALPDTIFAEGLTLYRGKLYLLSWRAGKGLILDASHFGLLGTFNYEGEGWGLCYHEAKKAFAMSNGSDTLQWRNPETFQRESQLYIHAGSRRFDALNELECHGQFILANQWKSNTIVVIDAATGIVSGVLDLTSIVERERASWTDKTLPKQNRAEAVLNGIAYDPADDSWLIGGKLWRHIYRIKIALPANPG